MAIVQALVTTLGILAVWIAASVFVHPSIGLAIFLGSTLWAGWDAHQVGLSRYKVWGPTSVATTVIGCLLLWVLVFPCYLIARSKILSGNAVLKDGTVVAEPRGVTAEASRGIQEVRFETLTSPSREERTEKKP